MQDFKHFVRCTQVLKLKFTSVGHKGWIWIYQQITVFTQHLKLSVFTQY